MRSAGLPVFLIGALIIFADCSTGSQITGQYTGEARRKRRTAAQNRRSPPQGLQGSWGRV